MRFYKARKAGAALVLLAAVVRAGDGTNAAPEAAPEAAKVLPLSLNKAVEIATAPDGATKLRLAQEQMKTVEARKRQALGALLPNVDASYTFRDFTNNMQSFGIQIPAIPGFTIPSLVGPLSTNDVRATASQSLFDLSAIKRYQASKAQAGVAKAEFDAARNQTRGAVAKAYYNALRAEAALSTAKANVAVAERVLRQAKAQKESGTGTGIDVTRAEVSLANERQRSIVAEEERSTARLNLLRSMNAGLDVELELTDSLKYKPADVPEAAKAVAAAREFRPELKAQAERERVAKLNYDATKYERVPTVGAFGDYGTIGLTDKAMLPTRTAGVSVKVPLWDGGRRDARRAESASTLRQEGIRTRDTAQQVELEIRLAVESLKSAEGQVKVALEAQAQAEKELQQAQRRYEAGVSIGLEVTDAQARTARARENSDAALFRQKAATIDLAVAVGNIEMILQ